MIIFLPILLFTLIAAPYLFLIPGGDGDVELKFAYLIANGNYSSQLLTFHPPFTLFLFNLFFSLFGAWSISILGLLLGIAGIIAIYHIGKTLFDKKIAILSSILLALSGLYLSTGLFSLNDFVMTVLIMIAFAYYAKSRYTLYALFISCAVLTKETAVLFALSVLAIELLEKKKHLITFTIPVAVFALWLGVLRFSGQQLWNAYNFSTTSQYGSTYTMLHNLMTLEFFNMFAYENWLHLFVFNFNWVYTIFACIGFFYLKKNKKRKELLILGTFSVFFSILVLGFQTWTINRYTLPLLPFLYLFAIYGATKVKHQTIWIVAIFIASLLSLSGSVDPVSRNIWPEVSVLDQKFFLSPTDGGDGMTYNLQYLSVMQERTNMLVHGQCRMPYLLSYDNQTLAILGIHHCLNSPY